jgi:AcrR family transcriptional regulator
MTTPAGLRERLVDAVVHAIERDGIEDLSLRTIASDAGVSRQAPYLHFADKREMLPAAAAAAMAKDRAGWERGMARKHQPLARLLALAAAHLRFAREHPSLHALVFGRYVAKSDLAELQREAIASFALLRETVAACLPARTPIERQRQCATIVWGTIRGLVELESSRQIPASVPGAVDELAEDAVRTLIGGWNVRRRR